LTFDAFVREFLEAKAQAEGVLARNARGDFSPDRNAERFPELRPVSNERRLPSLWNEFVADRQVSRGAQKKYKGILDALVARIGTDDMSTVAEHQLSDWIAELKKKKSRKTVKEGYAAAVKSFFGWAKRNKKLPTNPAAEIFVEPTVKAAQKKRGSNDAEASLILAATLAPVSHLMTPENAGARRWVPWLCAYILTSIGLAIWGPSQIVVPSPVGDDTIRIAGVGIRPQEILIFVVAITVMAALDFVMQRTIIGKAMRALAHDQRVASLMGINVTAVKRDHAVAPIYRRRLRRNSLNAFERVRTGCHGPPPVVLMDLTRLADLSFDRSIGRDEPERLHFSFAKEAGVGHHRISGGRHSCADEADAIALMRTHHRHG
jgi:Branched-chain amino acid transport system / permease component